MTIETAPPPPPAPSVPAALPQEGGPEPGRRGLAAGLSRNVVVLGAVSLFTDVSSEMIMPTRFLFLLLVLGVPLTLAGLIEGIAESVSSLLKIVAGRLADHVPERKPLILAGYTVSNVAKPLLALATAWQPALGLIVLDRVGKGVRGAPRDALLADSTPAPYRGKAFGFHRGMDTLGAAVGPLIAFAILARAGDDDDALRHVFAWTAVPGALSVLVLLLFLREKRRARPASRPATATGQRPRRLADLGAPFWLFTAIATVFALGNSSDSFLFLRTQGLERTLEAVPLVYFGYNVVYALLATPLGALSDRRGRVPVLVLGYAAFGLVYAGWAVANQGWQPWALFLLYGVYAAATEGVGKALVTDLTPRSQRGTALGWYNGLTDFASLPANVLGGLLWSLAGPGATFGSAAALGLAAAAALFVCAGLLSHGAALTPDPSP